MILHDDDGDDNDDNDDDCFCHRYMQAMSHGYACKCLLVSSLALIRHTNCFAPRTFSTIVAHAVASTAIYSKKAIPKTPVLSLPSKSAENLQGWRSHMHVMLAMLVGKQAVHNSCMNKQQADMHEGTYSAWMPLRPSPWYVQKHHWSRQAPMKDLAANLHDIKAAPPAGHTCVWSCYGGLLSSQPASCPAQLLGKKTAAGRGLSPCMYTQLLQ